MKRSRIVVSALSLSAAMLVGLIAEEGWSDTAIIPVKGDVPTVGPGLTQRPDGSPVRLGDTITPVAGIQRSLAHIQKDERGIQQCVTAPLSQTEYDLMVNFAYQYGVPTLCRSSMVRETNAGNYAAACSAYLKYKYVAGYDCATPGNKRCPGVWRRSQDRYAACMGAQG
jgi:GH24 family phage-related lysozyme (muramidase)